MNKPIHYLKYTKTELQEYCKDPASYVQCINDKLHIGLAPIGLTNFQEYVTHEIAHKKIGYFDKKYNGIVLDVRNIKVLGNEFKIHNDQSALHINLLAKVYVFQPEIGAVVKGVVKHIAQGHLSVTIHRVFNVSIRLVGAKRNFTKNSEISVKITRFELNAIIPYIEGVLHQIPTVIDKNKIKFEETVGDISGGAHDSGVSTEESTTKRKRKHSTTSQSSSSSSSSSSSDSNENIDSNLLNGNCLVNQAVKVKQEKRSDNSSESDSEHTDNNTPWGENLNNQDSCSDQEIEKNIKQEPLNDSKEKLNKNTNLHSSSSSSNESDDSVENNLSSLKQEPNDSLKNKKATSKTNQNLKNSSNTNNSSDENESSPQSDVKNPSIIKKETLNEETTSLTNNERQQSKKIKKRAIKNEPPSSSSDESDKSSDFETPRNVKKAKKCTSGSLKSKLESVFAKCISKTIEPEIKIEKPSSQTKIIDSPTKRTKTAEVVAKEKIPEIQKNGKKRRRDSVANLLTTMLNKKLNNNDDSLTENQEQTNPDEPIAKKRKTSINDKSSDCGGSGSGASDSKTKKSRKSLDSLLQRMIAQKVNESPKKMVKQEKEEILPLPPPPAPSKPPKNKKKPKNLVESLLNRMIGEKEQNNDVDDIIAEPKNSSVGNISSFNSPTLSSTLKPTDFKPEKKKKSKKSKIN